MNIFFGGKAFLVKHYTQGNKGYFRSKSISPNENIVIPVSVQSYPNNRPFWCHSNNGIDKMEQFTPKTAQKIPIGLICDQIMDSIYWEKDRAK